MRGGVAVVVTEVVVTAEVVTEVVVTAVVVTAVVWACACSASGAVPPRGGCWRCRSAIDPGTCRGRRSGR